jgi:hypothetical protein
MQFVRSSGRITVCGDYCSVVGKGGSEGVRRGWKVSCIKFFRRLIRDLILNDQTTCNYRLNTAHCTTTVFTVTAHGVHPHRTVFYNEHGL